jgi:hypothetical protein
VHPAAAEHRRDDLHLAELLRLGALERVAVEDDQVGREPGHELPATALVARQPRGCEDRRLERLLAGRKAASTGRLRARALEAADQLAGLRVDERQDVRCSHSG